MNSEAILALIGDLYAQIVNLTENNKKLRESLEKADKMAQDVAAAVPQPKESP